MKTSEVIYTFGFIGMLLADTIVVPLVFYVIPMIFDMSMWLEGISGLIIVCLIVMFNYGVFCFVKGFSIIVGYCDKKKDKNGQ